MDFLNHFLSFFINQNEILIFIIGIFFSIIESTLTMLLFTTILNINSSKSNKFLYVIIFSSIAIFSKFLIPPPYNIFVNILACPILVFLIFKTTFLKSILAEIIPFILFVLTSSLLMRLYTFLIKFPPEIINSVPIYKICYSLTLYSLIFIICLILKVFKLNINIKSSFKRKSNFILLTNFIIGIVAIAIQSHILCFYIKVIPSILIFSSISVLLIYFFFNIYSLLRTSELEKTSENLEEATLYNKTLRILYDNIVVFKHDFNNIVQSIGGYVYTDDLPGLKKYYLELVEDCQKNNNLSILNPELINNPGIYSLLTSKYYKADELGVNINFEIFFDLNSINMSIYDFTKIIGILLDNAIEAASKCECKIIKVIFSQDINSSKQIISIENTYIDKDIDINKIFEKNYTTKSSEYHGIGLWEIKKLLKKNNNLNLNTSKNDKFFKQQLEIYV